MESRGISERRLWWRWATLDIGKPKAVLGLLIVGLVLGFSSAIARPTHGYGDLIDEFCISRGRLRIAGHQPHCGMCHQPGTFDDLPANHVEPNWAEFERGKASGDFSYFCPGGTSASTQDNAPMATPSPIPNPVPAPAPSPSTEAADERRQMGMGMHGGEIDGGEMSGMGEMGRMRGRRQPTPPTTAPPSQSGTGRPFQAVPPGSESSTPTKPSSAPNSASGVLAIDRPPVPKPEVEQRLTKFRNDIGIKDPQRARWDAFAEAVRSAAQRRSEVATTPSPAAAASDGDAVSLLQTEQRHMSARIAALRYVSTAFTELLSVLDDTQRKIANEQLAAIVNTL